MASGDMIYIPSHMTIGSGIQVMLSELPQQSEWLQCQYHRWEGFIMHAFGMASSGMIYTCTYKVSWRLVQVFKQYKVLPQKFDRLYCWLLIGGIYDMPLRWLHRAWYTYPSFIKIDSGTEKLLLGDTYLYTDIHWQTARWSQMPTFIFSK
jgi:hypothetical protein